MSKIEQFSRLINHRVTGEGVSFTVPTSNDHTDETWNYTDLYIGEIGINVTDDTIWMRTNNGIVQLSASSSLPGGSTLWSYSSDQVQIGSTYSPTAIVRNTNSYVDLGDSTLRFKDLYLGGSTPSGYTTININKGFTLRDANDTLITDISAGTSIASIVMATASGEEPKTRPVHISGEMCTIGSGNNLVIIASENSSIGDTSENVAIIAGNSATFSDSASNVAYIGDGHNRDFGYSDGLGVGGQIYLRGVTDDGSTVYDESEMIKGQSKLKTSNALTYPIFTYEWSVGQVIQAKAKIIGAKLDDASKVYSIEILATGYKSDDSFGLIGDPIINEVSSFTEELQVYASTDTDGFYITVKGHSTDTVMWLCTYEYQKLINL